MNIQNQVHSQSQSLSLITGPNIKFTPNKPSIGKKKAIESSGNSPRQASKKQKTSGAFLEQSIEQLDEVTAISGVTLWEEAEQLLTARTEEKQASEAIQRVVQEEEERSILQKGPLQKEPAQIVARCGLEVISNDVEHCLSMCVEERLRNFIRNLIRISKQHQILTSKQKAREELENKQAEESEEFRKLNSCGRNPFGDFRVRLTRLCCQKNQLS